MGEKTLLQLVQEDIKSFFEQERKVVFCNECDFQMHLALYLRSNSVYDDVDVEYLIPDNFLKRIGKNDRERRMVYPWLSEPGRKTDLYIDIMVRKGGEYLPIELKFATQRYRGSVSRLGIMVEDAEILREQGAQDLMMYNTWKDVRRLEVLKILSPSNVKTGLSILLTNKSYFMKERNSTSHNAAFSLEGNVLHTKDKMWPDGARLAKSHPSFTLEKGYSVTWADTEFHPDGFPGTPLQFYYCTIEV